LSKGWYAVEAGLPDEVRWVGGRPVPPGSSILAASRFRVGSGPVARDVFLCEGRSPGLRVRVEMSEDLSVRSLRDPLVLFTTGDVGTGACKLEPRVSGPTVGLGSCPLLDASSTMEIRYRLLIPALRSPPAGQAAAASDLEDTEEISLRFALFDATKDGACWRFVPREKPSPGP
jgi:hypothetical protein